MVTVKMMMICKSTVEKCLVIYYWKLFESHCEEESGRRRDIIMLDEMMVRERG